MEAFLKKLAAKLYADYGTDMHSVCLIFPNRRASLFLKKHLASVAQKPLWLPQIFTIEDFVFAKSGLQKKDNLYLLVTLYDIYKSLSADKAQPFDEFVSWGNMLLRDFDEIDNYLADGKAVFNYLNEAKIIQHWNPDGQSLTEFETEYLRFYNSLGDCYIQFQQQLLVSNEGYTGLAFKQILQNISVADFSEWDVIVFAGFNALTLAEEKLIKFLIENNKARIFWDADEYYLLNKDQEAGHFLRRYEKENIFGKLEWIGDDLLTSAKNIEIIGVSGNVGQAKKACDICNDLINKGLNVSETAIVLVDENTLLPVLNSLPQNVDFYNVTMGLPFKYTNAFSLQETVMDLFSHIADKENAVFYYKHIQSLLNHPYIYIAFDNTTTKTNDFKKSFYNTHDFLNVLAAYNPALASIFEKYIFKIPENPLQIVYLLFYLIELIECEFISHSQTPVDADKVQDIDLEFLAHAKKLCAEVLDTLSEKSLHLTSALLQKIMRNIAAGRQIPFYGEPLIGLQIMGVLETRLLDFKNLIMLSVNEGMLPQGKKQSTFLIDDVRRAFYLPRYQEHNAVYAYHFYRLLQRAENVWLLYNMQEVGVGSSEKSRFITQLVHELPQINPNINIKETFYEVSPKSYMQDDISVPKDLKIQERLKNMGAYGFSPTAISRYTRCNLQFYYANILKLSPKDELSDSIDIALLGIVVHECLENTYQPYINKSYAYTECDIIEKNAMENLKHSFLARFSEDDIMKGRNMLIFKVAQHMISKVIRAEKSYLKENNATITILSLENELSAEIMLDNRALIKIKGIADRIDYTADALRIVDYKTGGFKSTDLQIKQEEDIHKIAEKPKLLQVMLYALMYKKQINSNTPIASGIISTRNSEYFMSGSIGGYSDMQDEIQRAFVEEIKNILAEIMHPDFLFVPTEDVKVCESCSFQVLCNRVSA